MRLRLLIALIRVTKILQTRVHVRLSARATDLLASRGEAMTFPSHGTIRPLLTLVFVFLAACTAAAPALAQEKKVAQQNGVDNSKMGAYRALAQHIYGISRKATWQRPR